MTFASLLIHTVTIYPFQAGSADRYGDAADGFGTGVATSARVQQVDTQELEIDRDTRIVRAKVFLPAGTAITATSEVAHGSDRYRVDGHPKTVSDASGVHHIEADLLRIDAG